MRPDESALGVRRLLSLLEGAEPGGDPSAWRRRLTALLTATRSAEIPVAAWPLLDEIWTRESKTKPIQRASELPRVTGDGRWTDSVSLWRGDITCLEAGAIVNAGNSGLTGCYIPFHACVDNAIHTAAGPWLRKTCEEIMSSRGRPEPTGTATVTPGFHLPASHVVHTVGPVVRTGRPTPEDEAALGKCYRTCLGAASELGLASIGFCAISTGIFGYPKAEAATVSLGAIRGFQETQPGSRLHVVLVAYSESDENTYWEAVRRMPE